MPWKETDVMSERMQFLARLHAGERMVDLCREFGITRTTGYKFKQRYERFGIDGIPDQSRAPHSPKQTPGEMCERIIKLRKKYPSWGPKKLKTILSEQEPGVRWPAASTISDILDREGLLQRRRRRRRTSAFRDTLTTATQPNDIWCVDYKGEFRLGSGQYCYPLTITDQYSRYIHACEGFERIATTDARCVFEEVFNTFGLPKALRSDNGSPFASKGLMGLTQLSAWWLALGLRLERITPGKPQQNGRHERMHRTLKAETTRPAAPNLLQQQQRFDTWRQTFNHIRPHESLGQVPPARIYKPSNRPFSKPILEYPLHDDVRIVRKCGHLPILRRRHQNKVYLSTALAGYPVGLRELDSGQWLVTFADLDLGTVEIQTMRFTPADQPGSSSSLDHKV